MSVVSRRSMLAAAPFFVRGRHRLFAQSPKEYSSKAITLVRESAVLDMLAPFHLNTVKFYQWMDNPASFTAADLERYRSSGLTVMHIATGVGTDQADAYQQVLRWLAFYNGFIAQHGRDFQRIDSVAAIRDAKKTGRIGILLGIQNSEHFRTAADVQMFYNLGQRISQLTYNSRNRIGNGSTERRDEGLSNFGVGIVERMNEAGMAVDVSHCGDRTTLDAFEVSKKPVLITHSNCRALSGHPRCKTDEAIRRMAKSGGVMGITAVRMFVRGEEPTTVEHVVDHFDHVKKLVGVEHLGVGSDIDLDGYDAMPADQRARLRAFYRNRAGVDTYGFREKDDVEGLNHPQRMFDLTDALLRRGYTADEVRGILGENFLRVLRVIWGR
ncbi:MAG: membrane dipeptidase [Acidobacteria bacterium]|nr:membrane dipeptidase [Acidobacteriota bacterium]